MEGLNIFNGTTLTLSYDVDQDANEKVTQIQENTTHKRAKRSALSQQMSTKLQETDKSAQQRHT